QGEPAALDLHHDTVPPPERVGLLVQVYGERKHGVPPERGGVLPALAVPPAHDLARHHQLVAAHGGAVGDRVRVHVDQFRYPVGVRTGGRGEQVCDHVTGHGNVLGERRGLP